MTTIEALIGVNNEIKINEIKRDTIIKSSEVNHILQLLLTIITGGFWIIIWVLISMFSKANTRKVDKTLLELHALKTEAEYKLKYK